MVHKQVKEREKKIGISQEFKKFNIFMSINQISEEMISIDIKRYILLDINHYR